MNRGIFPVLQMPLNELEEIEPKELRREIDWLISFGVEGVVLAMVSEVMRFSFEERRHQWQLVLEILEGRLPLIVSVGAESTRVAVKLAKQAASDGAAMLIATPPATYPATSDEIFSYYEAIVESVAIPVVVQDASNYMGQPLPMELYERLLEKFGTERIQFKPEAKPVRDRVAGLQEITGGKAKIFEGQSGMDLLETHELGLVGTMPGSEIVWAISKLWNSLESGDFESAKQIHQGISELIEFQQTIDAYVAVEKYLLVKQGIFTSARQRGPVSTILSESTKAGIDQVFEKLISMVD